MKWLTDNIISILALIASFVALWQSHRAAKLKASFEREVALSQIHEKMRPGRRAMRKIWEDWSPLDEDIHSYSDKKRFQEYYNGEFHKASSDPEKRRLSDEIHTLMHELNRVVDRMKRGEFTRYQVMEELGEDISMDRDYIRMYLEAHWLWHEEHQKPLERRFWSNVPAIVNDAESWESSLRNKTT
jgi:hypothetical protein